MIIYNITAKVHHSIDGDWLRWQQEEQIPQVMKTGFFNSYKLLRLLEQDDREGKTYAVQYFAETHEQYAQYIHQQATAMRQQSVNKWGTHVISFHSALEVIQ
jgi:hypothetical protein